MQLKLNNVSDVNQKSKNILKPASSSPLNSIYSPSDARAKYYTTIY